MEVDGVVEEPDVVGAIFGQVEGLLGRDLELRELQKTGRIGRIKVNIKSEKGKSYGEVILPSNLSKEDTAVVAAALETVDRVGPCEAKIKITKIEDVRTEKREYVVDRAKELLSKVEKAPESSTIVKEVRESLATSELKEYKGLPAGPGVPNSKEIILVEGRADVLNLLKHGIKNVIAIGGVKIPKVIQELSNQKEITAFLDGDRGGDLILKELSQVAQVDYVARAPAGKEVEELTFKEIHTALRHRKPMRRETGKEKQFKQILAELSGTRKACILDEKLNILGKVPINDLYNTIMGMTKAHAIVLDGYITKNLVNLSKERGIEYLVGKRARVKGIKGVEILTPKKL